jgi:hypothetical protein
VAEELLCVEEFDCSLAIAFVRGKEAEVALVGSARWVGVSRCPLRDPELKAGAEPLTVRAVWGGRCCGLRFCQPRRL